MSLKSKGFSVLSELEVDYLRENDYFTGYICQNRHFQKNKIRNNAFPSRTDWNFCVIVYISYSYFNMDMLKILLFKY